MMKHFFRIVLAGGLVLTAALSLGGCENPASDGERKTPGPIPAARTAQVSYAQTKDNSARVLFDVDAWTEEEAEEQWRLTVIEQGSVCFGVRKTPEQSIAVGGPSGAWVYQVPEGEAAEGSTAGAEFALFRVDTAQILDGGERSFTLTVTEPDKEPRTVQVSLEVEADLTQGVGVFFVGEEGRLVRITPENAETYANEAYVRDREANFERPLYGTTNVWRISFANVLSLFDALIWVDQYAQGGSAEGFQEYRIRVEKDEAIIPVTLSCGATNDTNRADYVRFTVWGYKQERTITRDSFAPQTTHYSLGNTSSAGALFCVGYHENKHIALRLGANITLQGTRLVVNPNSIVTLERGSKLTNSGSEAVWIPSSGGGWAPPRTGVLEMRGGAITNCGYVMSIALSGDYSYALGYPTKCFRFYSGTISGNGGDNLILCSSPSSRLPYAYFAVYE
jgi:hypothetical protein